jgi:hypothetical protein
VTFYQGQVKTSPFLPTLQDLPLVGFEQNGKYLPSRFPGADKYALCDNSKELHDRVIRYVDDEVQKGFDGFFVDNTALDPTNHLVCQASHPHLHPGMRGDDAFLALLADVREELHRRKPDAIIISNPFDPATADGLGTGGRSVWDLSDYVLWENYAYTPVIGAKHVYWSKSLIETSLKLSADPKRASKILALSYPANLSEAISSFALARIFGFNWTANLGVDRGGGHWGSFLPEIPFDLAEPVSPIEGSKGPLLHRVFHGAEAYANVGTERQPIELHSGKWYSGGEVQDITRNPTTVYLAPNTGGVWLVR